MLDNLNTLDLTDKDIALIEAALHTQKKILSVQSEAGGSGANKKLSELKHLMKRISRNTARQTDAEPQGWAHYARSLFCTECNHPR